VRRKFYGKQRSIPFIADRPFTNHFKEDKMFQRNLLRSSKLTLLLTLLIVASLAAISYGSQEKATGPMEISEDISCGKCGMFPAKYPQWQTQIVFADGRMAPFDGCKCMFGFLFQMDKFDQEHTPADIAGIWVREFNSGEWIEAKNAHYVVGSDEMGPMGKELIPFADAATAESFQQERGGQIALYDDITMETLKPLMGEMHMKKEMKIKGQMEK